MYIFIDTISPNSTIILFCNNQIIAKEDFVIKWKEYDNFLSIFLEFLNNNNLSIEDIKWIVTVVWPGWFTWTRIVTLTINSILFAKKIPLKAINYFELLELSNLSYPILIKANKVEYLFKNSKTEKPFLINKEEIIPWNYSWIGDIIDFENQDIYIQWIKDYNYFINSNKFEFKQEKIEPYYIKKPSITK